MFVEKLFLFFLLSNYFWERVKDSYFLKIFYGNKRFWKVNILIINFLSRFRMKKVYILLKCRLEEK